MPCWASRHARAIVEVKPVSALNAGYAIRRADLTAARLWLARRSSGVNGEPVGADSIAGADSVHTPREDAVLLVRSLLDVRALARGDALVPEENVAPGAHEAPLQSGQGKQVLADFAVPATLALQLLPNT